MSVKIEDGRRSIFVETEVPGSPEEVWEAIATGPGISSWFVPCELEGREGGQITMHFGPGMDSRSTVTEWDAPRRFAAINEGGLGKGGPRMGTEWTVEARSGGTCLVRVVHSLFADSDDWDNQLTGVENGWPGFFRVLRLYLQHFRGLEPRAFVVMGISARPLAEVWTELLSRLDLEPRIGAAAQSPAGAPEFSGEVAALGDGVAKEHLVVRLEKPGFGLLSLGVQGMGGKSAIVVTCYRYGASPAATAAEEAAFTDWVKDFAA